MEFHQLVGFYNVVTLGSFTRAAEATFRTQSALSQQIKKLEHEVGTDLFERGNKQSIQLTEAGKRVFAFAENTLRNRRTLLEDLKELKGAYTGRVSLAAPLAVMQCYIPDIYKKFTKKYPEIAVYFRHLTPQRCIDDVLAGDIDFAIVHGSTAPGSVQQIPWKKAEYALIVPKGHELTKKEVTIYDIAKYPLILPEKNVKFSARNLLDAMMEGAGLNYSVVMESPNVSIMSQYVMAGLGISCILSYEPFKELYKESLEFISLSHLFPEETVSIITRKGVQHSGAQESFLKHMLNS
ncbi:MAG: LysR family transcriptional regulator [Pseudomonadota bacterium]